MDESSGVRLNLKELFDRIRTHPDFPRQTEFSIFLNVFQSLSREVYAPNSLGRYKYAFNIVELGNLAKKMGLVPKASGVDDEAGEKIRALLSLTQAEIVFFSTFSVFRNLIADGFHAYAKETADEIIQAFSMFLQRLIIDPSITNAFKGHFQGIYNPRNTLKYIRKDPALEKDKIIKLFKQIKYFFQKSKEFIGEKNLEASAMAYLAGCTCVRNFNYVVRLRENERQEVKQRGEKLELLDCVRFYQDEEHHYIRDIIEEFNDLENRQRIYFAHVHEMKSKEAMESFLQEKINQEYEREFLNKLFVKIDTYLVRSYPLTKMEYEKDSPRAFNPQDILVVKKDPPKMGGDEKSDKGGKRERDDRDRDDRPSGERDRRRRNDMGDRREVEDKDREHRAREDRDRRSKDDLGGRRERDDRDRNDRAREDSRDRRDRNDRGARRERDDRDRDRAREDRDRQDREDRQRRKEREERDRREREERGRRREREDREKDDREKDDRERRDYEAERKRRKP